MWILTGPARPRRWLSCISIATSLVAIASLTLECSKAQTPSTQTQPSWASSPAARQPTLKPIDEAALKTMVETTARELMLPGAVVLLRTPQGEFTVNYGTTQLGATSPPAVDTHFRIASNTKTMTAAVILQLAQEHQLSLTDPVSKYVAEVPDGDNITIAQLLEMRSGLYNYTNAPEVSASLDLNPAKAWYPADLLAIAFSRPANFLPGTAYEYSNTNYVLLGVIAERVGRKPLAQAMQDRLFRRFQMRHTSLPAAEVNAIPEPYSHGYLYGSSSMAMIGGQYPPEVKEAARAGTLLPNDYTNVNHSFAGGAGGVISTASDVAKWIQALVTGKVLNAQYHRRWMNSFKPVDPSKPNGEQYGYGIDRLSWGPNAIYFHGGETAGFNSFIGHDPSSHMTLIVWTNLTLSLEARQTANTLMLKVLDQIYVLSPLAPPPTSENAQ